MRISRLMVPAVTLAGALALAGCGGSDNNNQMKMAGGGGMSGGGERKTNADDCGPGTVLKDGKCAPDTSMADAEMARAAATALRDANTDAAGNTYTDFKAAKGEKDHQKITLEGETFAMAVSGVTKIATASAGNPKDSYPLGSGNSALALGEATAAGGVFAPGPSRKDHTVDGGVFTTPGKWKGVDGTFHCEDACFSQNGHPTGSNWNFKPSVPESTKTTGDDAIWGWWAATDADGKTTHFEAFTHEGGLAATKAFPGTVGSATYEGDATGKYAVPGEAGDFTAKASLTAKFTTANAGTLSGEIRDFKDADGRDKAGWSVALQENNLNSDGLGGLAAYSGSGTAAEKRSTVWTRGGTKGATLDNAWDAELRGGDADKVSTHILGTFEAQHQGSHLIGAFGAEKTGEASE